MTISALPTPPLRSDPANFAARADAFLAALPHFAAEANATAAAMNLNATSDTSASSVAIGLGAKSFQVSAGKSFQGGMYLVIADAAAPSVNSMVCQVTSYSGTTLAVMVLYVRGSGTKASWVIGLSAPYDRDVGFEDGSQAAPGIAFEQDKDTGIRRTGPDAMALVTGGVDAVSVDSEGNLSARGNLRINNQKYLDSAGFGRLWANPSLQIGQANYAGLYGTAITYNAKVVGGAWQSIGGGTAIAITTDEGTFAIATSQAVGAPDVPLTWTTKFAVSPAGVVRIGAVERTWAGEAKTTDFGTYGALWSLESGAVGFAANAYESGSGQWKRKTYNAASNHYFDISARVYGWEFGTGDVAETDITWQRLMTLDSVANLFLGATAVTDIVVTGGFRVLTNGYGAGQTVVDIAHVAGTPGSAGFSRYFYNGASIGSITQSGTTAVAYNTTSDWRLKTNVRDSDARRFMQIRFRDFEWTDGRHDCGVIAHELQEIYPDLVSGEKDAVEVREVEVSPYVPAVTEERIASPAVEAVAAVEAAEAVEASPAEYRTVETPEVVLIDGIETTIIRRSLLEIKPAVEAKPAVAAVEGVEGKEAVIETIVITPEQPAVTELREFPVYQQVNYIGLIGRMGTRLQLVIRQTDAQQELIEQQQVLIGTLTARLDALNARLEVLESAA